MNKLKIDIIGECNTGKSTVAQILKSILQYHNIKVTVNDIDDDLMPNNNNGLRLSEKMDSLASKVEVEVNVIQLAFKPKPVIRTYLPEEVVSMLRSIDFDCGDSAYTDIQTLINKIQKESEK